MPSCHLHPWAAWTSRQDGLLRSLQQRAGPGMDTGSPRGSRRLAVAFGDGRVGCPSEVPGGPQCPPETPLTSSPRGEPRGLSHLTVLTLLWWGQSEGTQGHGGLCTVAGAPDGHILGGICCLRVLGRDLRSTGTWGGACVLPEPLAGHRQVWVPASVGTDWLWRVSARMLRRQGLQAVAVLGSASRETDPCDGPVTVPSAEMEPPERVISWTKMVRAKNGPR